MAASRYLHLRDLHVLLLVVLVVIPILLVLLVLSSSSSSSSTQHILKITVPASFQSICGFHPANPKVGILSTKILRMTISMHLKISLLFHVCSFPAIPTLHAKDQKS